MHCIHYGQKKRLKTVNDYKRNFNFKKESKAVTLQFHLAQKNTFLKGELEKSPFYQIKALLKVVRNRTGNLKLLYITNSP